MKIIKILLVVAIAYFGYQYYQSNFAQTNALVGTWKSHKAKSMAKHRMKGLTPRQSAYLEDVFGKMILTFTKDEMTSNLDGQIDRGTYIILDESGGCYLIEGTLAGESEELRLCIVEGDLHVPTDLATEVYVRQ